MPNENNGQAVATKVNLPFLRGNLTAGEVMFEVCLALLPAAAMGVVIHGLRALVVILLSVATALFTETAYNLAAKKDNTIADISAVVTGLVLALCLPAQIPLYIPVIGSFIAVLLFKCIPGGLGKNPVNPALAAFVILLWIFRYPLHGVIDGITSATPLMDIEAGKAVSIGSAFFGYTNPVIGGSAAAVMIGGLMLWVMGGITLHTPIAIIASFLLTTWLFGGQGFSYALASFSAGGIMLGAFFLATEPVSSPKENKNKITLGIIIGVLVGLLRVIANNMDFTAYIILAVSLFVSVLEKDPNEEQTPFKAPNPVLLLALVCVVTAAAVSGTYVFTRDTIAELNAAGNLESYKAVLPDAKTFKEDADLTAAVNANKDQVYGTSFGKSYINEAMVAMDGSSVAGYVVSVTNAEGMDGNITISVGFLPDGTVSGISYSELHDTPGLGMLCAEEPFSGQFAGVKDSFYLTKIGGTGHGIDAVAGATISSSASVNAVNAAVDFFNSNIG